jgi:amino acid transporter
VYAAIARDGLIPFAFAKIDKKTNIPKQSAIIHCIILSVITFILDLETLAKVISLGNLVSYASINACCLSLRYRKPATESVEKVKRADVEKYIWIFYFLSVALGICTDFNLTLWTEIPISIGLIFFFIQICTEKELDRPTESFSLPWSPFLPCLGILSNCLLAGGLPMRAWKIFGVWLIIGAVVYLIYGYWNS